MQSEITVCFFGTVPEYGTTFTGIFFYCFGVKIGDCYRGNIMSAIAPIINMSEIVCM